MVVKPFLILKSAICNLNVRRRRQPRHVLRGPPRSTWWGGANWFGPIPILILTHIPHLVEV